MSPILKQQDIHAPFPKTKSKKIGLVLSGGLFRNAFQVGVMEALLSRNFSPHVIVSVSSGAWNGACIVSGQLEEMRKFWFRVGELPKVSFSNVLFNKTIFNLKYIVHQIPKKSLDFHALCDSPIEFYVGATKVSNLHTHFFCNKDYKHDEFFSILMASNLIPGLYAWPVNIDNSYYIDGGFIDNVPYEVAFSAGCEQVYVVVHNQCGSILKKLYNSRGHTIPPEYNSRTIVISPERTLHRYCTTLDQIKFAIEEGQRVGMKVAL